MWLYHYYIYSRNVSICQVMLDCVCLWDNFHLIAANIGSDCIPKELGKRWAEPTIYPVLGHFLITCFPIRLDILGDSLRNDNIGPQELVE